MSIYERMHEAATAIDKELNKPLRPPDGIPIIVSPYVNPNAMYLLVGTNTAKRMEKWVEQQDTEESNNE